MSLAGLTLCFVFLTFSLPVKAQLADAFLPYKDAVPTSNTQPIDGVWTIPSIGKRIRIEGGRAYAVDPWVHAFILQIQPDMVVIQNIKRLKSGVYIGDDLPLLGQARFKIQPSGDMAVAVAGQLGPYNYTMTPDELDDTGAYETEVAGTDFGSTDDFANIDEDTPAEHVELETWYLYIKKSWCTGKGSGLARSAKGKVSASAHPEGDKSLSRTTELKTVSANCKKKFKKKSYKYEEGDPGLLVIKGTREQIANYSFTYSLRWKYKGSLSRKEHYHKKKLKSHPALVSGLEVGKSKDVKWRAPIKTLPDFYMTIRARRVE